MPAFLLPIVTGISNVLRLPALTIFLGQLAATVLAWLAQKVGRRAAMYLTVIGIVFALGLTTMFAINALLSTINYDAVPWLEQGFSYFIPNNAVPCLSVIFSARVIRWVWDWQFYAVNKAAS